MLQLVVQMNIKHNIIICIISEFNEVRAECCGSDSLRGRALWLLVLMNIKIVQVNQKIV